MLQRFWWRLFDDFLLYLFCSAPITTNPLILAGVLCPVTRDPLTARGQYAPEPAHPHEIAFFLVPTPVTSKPADVFAFGLFIRWKLFHRLWRFLGDL